ncbi:MAG TPA: hypothetical protein PKN48_13395 [Bacteroidales bacterium]|nr:hypothetical protein [Bacteroidales bacterium]
MASAKPYFFEEGQEYEFMVKNRVNLPPDDEVFFVLFSPFQTKHLLSEKPYINYNIVPGKKIRCRIDKINCTGKIYLEPEHPFYKEKNSYEFPVIGVEDIVNSDGEPEKMLVVEDCWHHHIFMNIGASDLVSDVAKSVKCRVDRIKKGKLYLSLLNNMPHTFAFEVGRDYEFRIHRMVTLAEDEEYFELIDESGKVHYLKKKYYKNYNFSMGDVIKCRFTAQPALFRHYLEPVHPYYKIGEVYDFFFSGIESFINESGEEVKKIMVSDGSEKDYFVSCDDYSKVPVEPGNTVRCLLKNIRMGRLVLVCA